MKKIMFFLLLCFSISNSSIYAQNVKYSLHTIAEGETLSVIAAKNHTTVGDIMRLNGMNSTSQLVTGQKIKIPSPGVTVERNNTQSKPLPVTAKSAKTDTSLTHYVMEEETLYSISKKFGVTVDELKKWNNLADNNIHFGQKLAVSREGVSLVEEENYPDKKAPSVGVRQEAQSQVENAAPSPNDVQASAADEPTANAAPSQTTNMDTTDNAASVQIVPSYTDNTATPAAGNTKEKTDNANGFFATEFDNEQGKMKSVDGDAMTFKTASGWNDKKYYILMNEAPAGSIVKISGSANKFVYAKVLWKMEDMKLNKDLRFRISDAAASALGIDKSKFNLTIQYYE